MKLPKLFHLLWTLPLVILLAGCVSPASSKQDVTSLQVAYMPNYCGMWSVVTAKEKGFFAEEGLDVNLVQFEDGPTIIAAMENGSIDFGYIGQGAHKLCVQGKASIIALSHISNSDALIGGPGITSVEDLRGKTVAYSSGTSSEDILFQALAAHNMTMKDIVPVDMDSASLVTAMLSGGVDACATWSPNSLTILNEIPEATKLADNLTFADRSIALDSWVVTPQYLEEQSHTVLAFLRALYRAMDYAAYDHQEEAAQWAAAQAALPYDVMYAQRGDAQWLTGTQLAQWAEDGTLAHYYQLQQNTLLEAGLISENQLRPVEDYVAFQWMVEAGTSLYSP